MSAHLFEAAPGIAAPGRWGRWTSMRPKRLTVIVDFKPGTRFAVSGDPGGHPVHDTVTKTYRHLNFFQHVCHLQVRALRMRLPHGAVRLVEPDFAGRLNGFTLLFEALILMLAQQIPFAAVARIVGESALAFLGKAGKHSVNPCGGVTRRGRCGSSFAAGRARCP